MPAAVAEKESWNHFCVATTAEGEEGEGGPYRSECTRQGLGSWWAEVGASHVVAGQVERVSVVKISQHLPQAIGAKAGGENEHDRLTCFSEDCKSVGKSEV